MDLQMIIGIDKRNPLFTIYRDANNAKVYIYYGAILHEVIDDKKDNPELKLMLARLYNAKVSVKSLIANFGYSYPTLRRWGLALKSGDTEKLLLALSGQGAKKKLTPEIISFAIHDFGHVYPRDKYKYSSTIIKDIKKVYKVSLSPETLRPLFAELKSSYNKDKMLAEETKKKIFKAYL